MTSHGEHILGALRQVTGPICDDCLTRQLNLPQRQQAYQRCEQLVGVGLIGRGQAACVVCAKVKKASWGLGVAPKVASASMAVAAGEEERPWHWEGNVQAQIVAHLVREGYTIDRAADTASRENGQDIIAIGRDGRELWVSVKGFPSPKASTNSQARHWFAHAIFDLVLYRGDNPRVHLAIGLPDGYPTYQNLARRVNWFQRELPFLILWVDQGGGVRVS